MASVSWTELGAARYFRLTSQGLIYVASLSKAFGCPGDFVAFPDDERETVRALSAFATSTPLPSALAATTPRAVALGVEDNGRRRQLEGLPEEWKEGRRAVELDVERHGMPIASFSFRNAKFNRRVYKRQLKEGAVIPWGDPWRSWVRPTLDPKELSMGKTFASVPEMNMTGCPSTWMGTGGVVKRCSRLQGLEEEVVFDIRLPESAPLKPGRVEQGDSVLPGDPYPRIYLQELLDCPQVRKPHSPLLSDRGFARRTQRFRSAWKRAVQGLLRVKWTIADSAHRATGVSR